MKDYFGKDITCLKEKKLYLFDMDGTIYIGDNLFPGVKEFFDELKALGKRFVFITNNSSRSVKDYLAKMLRIGICGVDEKNFYTSGQAALSLMKEKHADDLIYMQATRSLIEEYKQSGLNITERYEENIGAVLVGFDPEFTGNKVTETCKVLTLCDVPYYATNPDWLYPIDFGYIPDCGSMCFCFEKATGKKPIYIGKPSPVMIETVMKDLGYDRADTVVIGDRLYTDIASGNNAGVDTICVLTGEVKIADVEAAKGQEVPTYLLNSVTDIPLK